MILAIDRSKSKKDPLVLIERQFRHAAQHYLYEVPAGKMEPGEDQLDSAKRELMEETGYAAKKWTKLVRYFASPGFLGEWMQVFLAEDLTPGKAQPEEDESFELQFVPLSELLRLIDARGNSRRQDADFGDVLRAHEAGKEKEEEMKDGFPGGTRETKAESAASVSEQVGISNPTSA